MFNQFVWLCHDHAWRWNLFLKQCRGIFFKGFASTCCFLWMELSFLSKLDPKLLVEVNKVLKITKKKKVKDENFMKDCNLWTCHSNHRLLQLIHPDTEKESLFYNVHINSDSSRGRFRTLPFLGLFYLFKSYKQVNLKFKENLLVINYISIDMVGYTNQLVQPNQ